VETLLGIGPLLLLGLSYLGLILYAFTGERSVLLQAVMQWSLAVLGALAVYFVWG
jgi:asparagine N-glycosylation enzyme membrane subunit Stt3